jgi:hypothetical protein
MSSYYVGTRVVIGRKYDLDGVPFNPAALRLRIRAPNGRQYVYPDGPICSGVAWTNPVTGTFKLEIVPTIAGQWGCRWESTAVGEERFDEEFFTVLALSAI